MLNYAFKHAIVGEKFDKSQKNDDSNKTYSKKQIKKFLTFQKLITQLVEGHILPLDCEKQVEDFEKQQNYKAKIFLKTVDVESAKRFGIALLSGDRVSYVEEKPENPQSNFAITGFYILNSKVFDIIKTLEQSNRGELEITDVIDAYVQLGTCNYDLVNGFWSDAGTFESLYQASKLVRGNK